MGGYFALTAKIAGKVWNAPVDESEVSEMQNRYRVINISVDDVLGKAVLRVLSETQPTADAKAVTPTLEDYYLYVFGSEI